MYNKLNAIPSFLFKSDSKLLLFLIIFILLVILVTFVALNKIETQTKIRAQHSLSTVLLTTQEALYLWLGQTQSVVRDLASSKEVLNLTNALLTSKNKYKKETDNPDLIKIRNYIRPKLSRFGNKGFFIITPDNISIASMRDSNIGTINLIHKRRKNILLEAFNGETKFIATIPSDVALYDENGLLRENLPTQFIVSPIHNNKKKVIAVLAIRLDPAKNFSRIIQLGRIGQSGETYAFDDQSVLISESRFDDELKILGMIKPDSRGISKILITDPGDNLKDNYADDKENNERPLTLMAKNAIAGHAGYNTNGYRDYRGVRVFGAWLWDDKLGFGLTTEIDESEAMEPYYSSRLILMSVLTFTLMLMFLLINIYRVEEKEKQTIFATTVSMTQHILNNILNQMQLFQLEAEQTKDFDDDVKSLIDESINEGKQLVEKLSSVKEMNENAIRNSIYTKNSDS